MCAGKLIVTVTVTVTVTMTVTVCGKYFENERK